jgi:hypothetical protein
MPKHLFAKSCAASLSIAVALTLTTGPARASDTAAPGVDTDSGASIGASINTERLTLPAELPAALAALAIGETLDLDAFPLGGGRAAPVTVRPLEIYAPGAHLWVITDGRQQPAERSRRRHFAAVSRRDPSVQIVLSLAPERGTLRGTIHSAGGDFSLREPDGAESFHRLEPLQPADGPPLTAGCGTDTLRHPMTDDPFGSAIPLSGPAPGAAAHPPLAEGGQPANQAVIAVDTDNEWLFLKFANSTAAATDWIADLFAEMNVLYERDLDLRLLQGETFFRLDTDVPPTFNDDPWNVSGSPAGSGHLNEFGSYWASNFGSVERVFAMLLSGKSSSPLGSSGIAWVDGYCEKQSSGGGYSVSQTFGPGIAISNDVRVIAHEVGHNLGSPHTHCYSPPVDECFNAEGGCYNGPESCPGGPGTLMSYCHFTNHANCGANRVELHPRVMSQMASLAAAHSPFCIMPLDAIFSDSFDNGSFSAWSSTVQ